jgi:hypothetical protein
MKLLDALALWDLGVPVLTVEMGGLGPGYEQCIQILIWEMVRDAEPLSVDLSSWGEKALSRVNDLVGGLTGAQVGAAKSIALHFLKYGYEETLAKVPVDRRIMASKHWPTPPSKPNTQEEKKTEPEDTKRIVEV